MDNIEISTQDVNKYMELIQTYAIQYGTRLIGAILLLVIGLFVIKKMVGWIKKYFAKKDFDKSLESFVASLLGAILKTLLFVSVLGTLGLEMTSFVAILGAAGLAIGMALSGTLQNFAGGVVILLLKPFKVGQVIEAQGYLGTVKEIQIFHTILNTFDKKVVIIPNGPLSSGSLTNYSVEEVRRVDWIFGIAYGDSYDKAKEVLLDLIKADERILNDPEPFIALESLGDSSVNIVVRVWSNASDMWPVKFDMNEKVYKKFAEEGLSIPFPQMDVHLHKDA
jgi:small conductance mechanosensitive channel